MQKKSQMVGQIFIFVLATVLIGFILIFGYNSIMKLKDKIDDVSFIKFKNDLGSEVEILASDYGSVKIKNFEVPPGCSKVCFVKDYGGFPQTFGILFNQYPLMRDSVNSGVKKNVFLVADRVKESFFIENVYVREGVLCVDVVNNIIKIKLEGGGDHAIISE